MPRRWSTPPLSRPREETGRQPCRPTCAPGGCLDTSSSSLPPRTRRPLLGPLGSPPLLAGPSTPYATAGARDAPGRLSCPSTATNDRRLRPPARLTPLLRWGAGPAAGGRKLGRLGLPPLSPRSEWRVSLTSQCRACRGRVDASRLAAPGLRRHDPVDLLPPVGGGAAAAEGLVELGLTGPSNSLPTLTPERSGEAALVRLRGRWEATFSSSSSDSSSSSSSASSELFRSGLAGGSGLASASAASSSGGDGCSS